MADTSPDARQGANSGRPRRNLEQAVADLSVAAVVRSARLARGWTQKELAERSGYGLTEKGYPKLDTGAQPITAAQFFHICEIFGIDPGESINRAQRLAGHLGQFAQEPLDRRALMVEALEWLASHPRG